VDDRDGRRGTWLVVRNTVRFCSMHAALCFYPRFSKIDLVILDSFPLILSARISAAFWYIQATTTKKEASLGSDK
jgi:hypothetical protein